VVRSALWRLGAGSHLVDGLFQAQFDRSVARRLEPGPGAFVGQPYASRRSFERARRLGLTTVLNHVNANIQTENSVITAESEALGIRPRSRWPLWIGRVVDEEVEIADVVLVPSRAVWRDLRRRGVPAAKLRLLRYGVDGQAFEVDENRRLRTGPVHVVYVGQVAIRKGVHHLDAAIGLAGSAVASCTAVGGVIDRQLIARTRHTSFTGPVDHGAVGAILRRADVFAFPSMAEGMARAVLEAMASGIPVITTAEAGYEGVIRDGENGFLVPVRAPEAIADVLQRLARDQALRAEVGRAARASAEELSWERHGRGFLAALGRPDPGTASP
jgi:glycosyltransferase involved in cell wall biosynthesis